MSSSDNDTRTKILRAAWELMENDPGKSVSMSQIAKATGISRQAVYLHFASRTELLIATIHYVDEVKGLDQRLEALQSATSGTDMLERYVEVWGNYIPEIYGVSKALMLTKANDEAAAAAWNEVTNCLRHLCVQVMEKLQQEKKLNAHWITENAADLFWVMISIDTWEQLTQDCGWTTQMYVEKIAKAMKSTFITN
jgi:AcrR family transcriptional regulator